MVRVLDLRATSGTCTDNPMVKFLNVINRGEDPEVHLIARREDLPVGLLRMVASKSGYEVVEVKQERDYYTARLRKVVRG